MDKKQFTTLVPRAQKGDATAINELLEHCYQDLYHFAYQTVKDPDLAADITQESCIDILNHLDQLRSPDAFGVWARQITYRQCTRHFRQTKEYQLIEDEDGESILNTLPDENPASLPEQVMEDKEFQKAMQDLLDSLPAEQRSAMMLYYYEKLSVKQIADVFETSEGTIKSRLNYGRKALKNKVEEYEKKNGVRLHSFALPLLLKWLFSTARDTLIKLFNPSYKGVAIGATGAGATSAAVSTGAAASTAGTATTAGAATGAAVATGLGAKIAAGVVAAALAAGSIVGGVTLLGQNKDTTPSKKKANPGHTHHFSTTYYDENNHWGICDCGERYNPSAHSFDGRYCTACDYVTASEGLEYMQVEGGYAVIGMGTCTDTCISIPSSHQGEPVVAVQPAHAELYEDNWGEGDHLILHNLTAGPFEGNKKIESVFIPRSVAYIGADAFAECTSLSKVVLAEGVERLEEWAFYNCSSLKEITIPSTVKRLYCPFEQSGLVKVTVSPGVTNLDRAFIGCEKLTDATIPNTVTTMQDTFDGCKSLTQLPIPQSVTSLQSTFSGCDSLTDIVLPEWITSIDSAFSFCQSLTSVVVPEGVTNIDWAFYGCTSLTNVVLPKGITSMYYAFSDCTALTDIVLPEGITDMYHTFSGCTSLTNVVLPKSITNMFFAFSDCTALTSVVVPEGITNISDAFTGCTSLTSVTVPESVTTLDGFIRDCSSLTDIYYKGTTAQWEMVREVGSYWKTNTGDFVVHCTDGDIPKAQA